LFNSKDHPLPILPVIVGQVDSRAQVEALIAPGQRPIIFQISNANGPDFNLAKAWMFSEMALEYPNAVNFVKAPAGSEAAKALYPHDVTKPVYFTVDPAKGPSQVPMFIDEAQLKGNLVVNQVAIEALIVKGSAFSRLFSPRIPSPWITSTSSFMSSSLPRRLRRLNGLRRCSSLTTRRTSVT
jgi:hypothetical protein